MNENKHLILSGVLFTIILVAWPVRKPPGSGLQVPEIIIKGLWGWCAVM